MICASHCLSQDQTTNKFLKNGTNLTDKLPEELTEPSYFDEVTDRLESEECRIESATNSRSPYKLRDEIYRTRKVRFHWNLDEVIEATSNMSGPSEGLRKIEGDGSNFQHCFTPCCRSLA